jgi:hypothetical protein
MKHLRTWRAGLGLAVLALALASSSSSAAQPKGGPKEEKGHHAPGKPPPGKDDKGGGPRDEHGRGKPDFDRGRPERGAAGASGFEGHRPPHAMPEGLKQRLNELKQKESQGKLTPEEKQELERLQRGPGQRMSPEQRKARLAELQQKLDGGTLTPEEKAELDKAQRMQTRHEALDKQAGERAQNRKHRSRDAKRQALKEYPNLSKDAAAMAEYRKHSERLAKLERAKELATAEERTDLVAKIDTLIAKEKERHQAWVAKHPANAQPANQGAAQ